MTQGLILETRLDLEKNEEDLILRLNRNPVFQATRYDDYSTIHWQVNPNGTKEFYFRKLLEVLTSIPALNPVAKPKPNFKTPFVYLTDDSGSEELPFHQASADSLPGNSHFRNFRMLRVYTEFLDFTMEDFTGPWKPETGRISVLSHNDLSYPVDILIAQTALYSIPAVRLQPILAERVYRFSK